MAAETVFQSALAQTALVFVLVFTVIFAVLQKSKILGDDKKQIDSLVALAIALIVISVGYALDIITALVPILAVGLVIILVFLLLWGMVFVGDTFKTPKGVRIAVGVLAAIVVIVAVMIFSGGWEFVKDWFSFEGDSTFIGNVIIILVIAAALATALWGGKEGGGKDKKE